MTMNRRLILFCYESRHLKYSVKLGRIRLARLLGNRKIKAKRRMDLLLLQAVNSALARLFNQKHHLKPQ